MKLFKSSHGKGEHYGAGAFIKRTLTHEQPKVDGLHINCVTHVVEYLRKNDFLVQWVFTHRFKISNTYFGK